MKIFSAILLVIAATLCTLRPVHAFEVSAYGGTAFASVGYNPALATTGGTNMGLTYGAGLALSAMPGFDIEGDLLFAKRKFGVSTTTDLGVQYLEIPLILRATLVPFVSLGAGLYYATSMSDTLTQSVGANDTQISFGSLNWKKNDLGAVLVAGGHMPIVPTVHLKLDVRYLIGLASISTDTTRSDKWNSLEILAGLSFGI